MQIQLRVNRVSHHKVEDVVMLKGEEVTAEVTQIEVEMHDEAGIHGSATLRYRGKKDISEAKDTFKEGELVTVTFEAAAPAEAPTEAA